MPCLSLEPAASPASTYLIAGHSASVYAIKHTRTEAILTSHDLDRDWLLLLYGLSVIEPGIADIICPGVLWLNVGEIEVSIETL